MQKMQRTKLSYSKKSQIRDYDEREKNRRYFGINENLSLGTFKNKNDTLEIEN